MEIVETGVISQSTTIQTGYVRLSISKYWITLTRMAGGTFALPKLLASCQWLCSLNDKFLLEQVLVKGPSLYLGNPNDDSSFSEAARLINSGTRPPR